MGPSRRERRYLARLERWLDRQAVAYERSELGRLAAGPPKRNPEGLALIKAVHLAAASRGECDLRQSRNRSMTGPSPRGPPSSVTKLASSVRGITR